MKRLSALILLEPTPELETGLKLSVPFYEGDQPYFSNVLVQSNWYTIYVNAPKAISNYLAASNNGAGKRGQAHLFSTASI